MKTKGRKEKEREREKGRANKNQSHSGCHIINDIMNWTFLSISDTWGRLLCPVLILFLGWFLQQQKKVVG